MLKELGQSLRRVGTEYTKLCSRELDKLKSMQLLYEAGEGTWCSLHVQMCIHHAQAPQINSLLLMKTSHASS